MNSALGQNDRYIRYISAIWEGPLRVTAELIEMVQYVGLWLDFDLLDHMTLITRLTGTLLCHSLFLTTTTVPLSLPPPSHSHSLLLPAPTLPSLLATTTTTA
jgi:hypothetical protein